MVSKLGLRIRMLLVGSILFGIYALAMLALMSIYNIGAPVVIILTGGFVVFQYWLSQKLILRGVSAQELPSELGWIDDFASGYCRDRNMKKPKIYLAQMGVANAFAFGRKNKGTVVVSKELVNKLEREEVKGVVAHELAHIENRDSLIMLIGQSISTIVGIGVIIAGRRRGLGFIGALIAAQFAQFFVSIILLTISRYREYLADESAASYMDSGEPLARALSKISADNKKSKSMSSEVGALCIIDPGELLSTHPPVEKRIDRLNNY